MSISFDHRVALITGAGAGLGRAHAVALAKRGVKIILNDLHAPEQVADEIKAAGGDAIAVAGSVTDEAAVARAVDAGLSAYGKIDILVNNAGILRDKSFAKMTLDDFRAVFDVHVMGSVICTKAVWELMREQNFGRVVMTTSSSGMYGNFGQANYGAAKAALTGLMQTLSLEGAKYNVKVNALSPLAATAMTEGLMPQAALDLCTVEPVAEGLVYLACDEAPTRLILVAGANGYAVTKISETVGVTLPAQDVRAESLAERWSAISDEADMAEFDAGSRQAEKLIGRAKMQG